MALSSETPLTQHELPVYLESAQRPEVRRWVVLTPLAKDEYDMKTRILDLVHRMMTAKIHGQERFVQIRSRIGECCRQIEHEQRPCMPYGETGLFVILSNCERQTAVHFGQSLSGPLVWTSRRTCCYRIRTCGQYPLSRKRHIRGLSP